MPSGCENPLQPARANGSTPSGSNGLTRPPTLPLLLVALVGLAVWVAFLPPTLAHNPWIYSWDSAAYIETAQSILAGRGLVHRPIWGLSPDIWVPIAFWPPGYPILIALAQLIGLSTPPPCLAVSLGSSGIFVILMAYVCCQLFPWTVALPILLVTISMPAFLYISTSCLSDASYLTFAMGSLACLSAWSLHSKRSWWWLTAAGLLAGTSWSTRYVGLALFAATACFLL